jgi:hypothetical protein
MSNKETGGPAFPVHPDMAGQLGCVPSSSDAGMTLRDYFAAKASEEDIEEHLNGPKAEHIVKDSGGMHRIVHKNTIYTREQAKYRYADAMLKAREA